MRTLAAIRGASMNGVSFRPRAESPDPAAIMAAFERYNTRFTDVTDGLGKSIDELNAQLAAMKISGSGRGGGRVNPLQRAHAETFNNWFRTGRGEDAVHAAAIKASMQEGSDPDGGYLAPVTIDQTVQDQLLATSPMRSLAQIDTISVGARYDFIINKRGTTSGWRGETEEPAETATPNLSAITMSEGELYAEPFVTQRLLDDSSFDVQNFLSSNISDEFALQEAIAFINGDGGGKPRGILTYPVATDLDTVRPFGTLQYIATGAASDFPSVGQGDVLINLLYSLRAPYRAGASWLLNSNTAGVIRKFKDSEGRYIWTDSLIGDQPATLLGYPVAIEENMPDVGSGAFPIAFGNFKRGYRILDRLGIRVLRDPFTKKGFVSFYTTKRVGGSGADSNAIKLLKVAAS